MSNEEELNELKKEILKENVIIKQISYPALDDIIQRLDNLQLNRESIIKTQIHKVIKVIGSKIKNINIIRMLFSEIHPILLSFS